MGGVTDDKALDSELRAHVARVRRRNELTSGAYPDESEEVRMAAAHVRRLRTELGLGRFVCSLTSRGAKPRFLLVFQLPPYGEVVLKAYGRPRPGEVHLERLWGRRGVPTVDILDADSTPDTWMLMRRLPLAPLTTEPLRGALLPELTDGVARLVVAAHSVADLSPEADALRLGYRLSGPAVQKHLEAVSRSLVGHGYRLPAISEQLIRAHAGAAHPLHGDLGLGNVVRDARDGQLRLLDASAYVGPREFDAARWAARLGGAEYGEALLERWLSIESGLDRDRARLLLGGEMLMEAGVREIIKDEQRQDAE